MPFRNPFVVLPTYNERENLAQMIPALFGLSIPNLSVLVVDDSSPDGTAALVKQLQPKYPTLFLLGRPKKEGLGKAYIAGFREALQKGADCILQMDSDFSHNPKDVPQLLGKLKDSDVVIGSRYIKGGGTLNWAWYRILLSKFGNLYARWITGAPVSDLTAGFKAWRDKCLRAIEFENIQTNGYGFQIETVFTAWKRGFKITEVPIIFTERSVGQSKMSREIIWEALLLVWKLRLNSRP